MAKLLQVIILMLLMLLEKIWK